MRVLWISLGLGLFLFCNQACGPKYDQRYPIEYKPGKQSIDLGEVPSGLYILSVANFSDGEPKSGPIAKIEVNDSTGTNVYYNIHRNSDRQYIFPEFEIPNRRRLTAVIELHEPKQIPGIDTMLWLKTKDRAIFDYSSTLVYLAIGVAIAAIVLFQIRARASKPKR